ncbi:MAG: hypothetical protein JXR77_13570, partial [Lentisphaeria bacterium]|nr:hypothetical protein [Lentisphaeria bacterium]
RLLRGAERRHDGIAIYYSMPTILAGALTGEEGRINAARDAWVKLIEDNGLQYEFVAYRQVADGILDQGAFRAVILPYTLALSVEEANALRRFVHHGGTVLATRPVGVRDDLGRPQAPGLLDDLFGAAVEGTAAAVEPLVTLAEPIGGLTPGTELRLPVGLSNVVLRGGRAAATAAKGSVPVLIRGSSGRAVLLNLDLTYFEQERRFHSPTERRLRALVLELLDGAGVRPAYPLVLASGRAPHVEVVRYRADGIEFLCLLHGDDTPDVATIELSARRRVYDVRAGSERGEMTTLQVPLEPKCARLYCLTDLELPRPVLRAPGRFDRPVAEEPGGWTTAAPLPFAVARTAAGAPSRQLLRLTVTDGAGRERDELMQTVWVADAALPLALPLALNDPRGPWTLTATDVISGRSAAATVEVR